MNDDGTLLSWKCISLMILSIFLIIGALYAEYIMFKNGRYVMAIVILLYGMYVLSILKDKILRIIIEDNKL